MVDNPENRRGLRISTFLLPLSMLGGALAAGLIVVNDPGQTGAYTAFDEAAFQNIEFVARSDRPDARALSDALDRACAATGCDAGTLHPMILASVSRMTTEELETALEAQARVRSESRAVRARSLPGTEAARMAELEILAAERIAAVYETELALR